MADKYLRPNILDADPSSTDAADHWTHWKKTFDNFIKALNSDQNQSLDKLALLTNLVSPNIHRFISQCSTFEESIQRLTSLFIKPKNEIFARYLLATRKQLADETLDQFLEALKQLSSDCNFADVTAAVNQENSIRDAFISGLASNTIRQRLLENQIISLTEAITQARTIETAQQQSSTFFPSTLISIIVFERHDGAAARVVIDADVFLVERQTFEKLPVFPQL